MSNFWILTRTETILLMAGLILITGGAVAAGIV